VAAGRGDTPAPSWPTLRLVLLGLLVVADSGTLAALAIARPHGWGWPFAVFATVLVGLIGWGGWALRHRRDR
jgi:hypothetical protein